MKMTAEELVEQVRKTTPLTRQEMADRISDYYGIPRKKVKELSEEDRLKAGKILTEKMSQQYKQDKKDYEEIERLMELRKNQK